MGGSGNGYRGGVWVGRRRHSNFQLFYIFKIVETIREVSFIPTYKINNPFSLKSPRVIKYWL